MYVYLSFSVRSGLQIAPRYAASAACFLQAPYVPRRHEVQCFTRQAAMNLSRLWYRERMRSKPVAVGSILWLVNGGL